MPFLVSRVLWHEVKVLATNDESAVHLSGNDSASQDPAANGDHASEWALLVCRSCSSVAKFLTAITQSRTNVVAIDCSSGSLEA